VWLLCSRSPRLKPAVVTTTVVATSRPLVRLGITRALAGLPQQGLQQEQGLPEQGLRQQALPQQGRRLEARRLEARRLEAQALAGEQPEVRVALRVATPVVQAAALQARAAAQGVAGTPRLLPRFPCCSARRAPAACATPVPACKPI
jgi:hypothetical protein